MWHVLSQCVHRKGKEYTCFVVFQGKTRGIQACSEVTDEALPEMHQVFQKRRRELPIKPCFEEQAGLDDLQRSLTLKSLDDCNSAAASKCCLHIPPHHERINQDGIQGAGQNTHSGDSLPFIHHWTTCTKGQD